MTTRRTLYEALWPDAPEFDTLRQDWGRGASKNLLSYVWKGCDALRCVLASRIGGFGKDLMSIERGITQALVPEIRRVMPPASPFDVEHGFFEFESLATPNAQPPTYDIAFVDRSYRRLMWPIEAKVLKTDSTLAEYVKEITDNFLTCRYAPFASEAAMLGYLLKGNPSLAFQHIEKRLKSSLSSHPDFLDRNHKISDHRRKVPKGKNFPSGFTCHHLLFQATSPAPDPAGVKGKN